MSEQVLSEQAPCAMKHRCGAGNSGPQKKHAFMGMLRAERFPENHRRNYFCVLKENSFRKNSLCIRNFLPFCTESPAHAHRSQYNRDVTDSSENNLQLCGEGAKFRFELKTRFQTLSTHPKPLLRTTVASPTVLRAPRTRNSLSTKSKKTADTK